LTRKLNLFVFFVLSFLFLTSCEKLFTLEGTIYLKEGERIERLSGTKIYLLNNSIEKVILSNLDEYKKESKAAIKTYEKKLLQKEIENKEIALKKITSQIKKDKISLGEAKNLVADNLKKFSDSNKKTTDAELKITKENLKAKLEILNSKKEIKLLNALLESKKRKFSSVLIERRKELKKLIKKKDNKLAESKRLFSKDSKVFKKVRDLKDSF